MTSVWDIVPGGRALVDWFGRVPHFHDAYLFELQLNSSGQSLLRTHTWEMTDKVDERGFFILEKHVVVTFALEGIRDISLSDFNLVGIIYHLEMTPAEAGFRLAWDSSYGVAGTIEATQIHISFEPGAPTKC